MNSEIEVLKLVCRRLQEVGIPYMLTGSLAANFYATPRMTRDIDMVIEMGKFEVAKFFRSFQDDFYIVKESIVEAITHEGMFNIIHNASVYKIDFVIRKDSPYRDTEFQRRREIDLDGTPMWIVSPEDLILSKMFWSKDSLSDFQLRDVRNLLSSVKNLDVKYIQKWVQTLELNAVYDKVKSHG
jgi:hypothetical protein